MDDEAILFEAIYDELRRLAGHLGGRQAAIQPTSLVHEAWFKIREVRDIHDKLHFSRLAARAMRQVLVDRVRHQGRDKRGGGWERVTLAGVPDAAPVDVLELNDALQRLAEADPVAAELVELRFFGGLTEEESAASLGVSVRSVQRKWRSARALLNHLLAS